MKAVFFNADYLCYVHKTLVPTVDLESTVRLAAPAHPHPLTRGNDSAKGTHLWSRASALRSALIAKAVWHGNRRHQTPCVDAICHPCAHNLHPASPICSANSCKVTSVLEVDVLRKQGSHPAGGQHEDNVEKGIVVLCASSLIVFTAVAVIGLFIFVIVVKSISRQTASFDRSAESFGAHFAARCRRLRVDKTMLCGVF